jgi:hypothetical protein
MSWVSLAGSVLAVLLVAWLVGGLGLGQGGPLDEPTARRIAEETFIGHRFGAVALDRDGRAALVEGTAGEFALVRAHGDKWVARLLRAPVAARREGETLILPAGEAMFGSTTLMLGADDAARWASRLQGLRDA